MRNFNTMLADLWKESPLHSKRRIESVLLKSNEAFIQGAVNSMRRWDYGNKGRDDALNIARMSILKALSSFNRQGGSFLSWWAWKMHGDLSFHGYMEVPRFRCVSLHTEYGEDCRLADFIGFVPPDCEPFVRQSLAVLPTKEKYVLERHYFDGLDLAQVAHLIGHSREAARVIRNRALRKLKSLYKKEGRYGKHSCGPE